MVDFKKLAASKGKPKPVNPREIFNSLPKPPGITLAVSSCWPRDMSQPNGRRP